MKQMNGMVMELLLLRVLLVAMRAVNSNSKLLKVPVDSKLMRVLIAMWTVNINKLQKVPVDNKLMRVLIAMRTVDSNKLQKVPVDKLMRLRRLRRS